MATIPLRSYLATMKTESRTVETILAASAAALLVGCASPDLGSTQSSQVRSTISVTPSTDPVQLIKWSQYAPSLKSVPVLRSIDTYTFVDPTGYSSARDSRYYLRDRDSGMGGNVNVQVDGASASAGMDTDLPRGGTTFSEAGAAVGGGRLFRHTPGQR
jgi:hypothetical protein